MIQIEPFRSYHSIDSLLTFTTHTISPVQDSSLLLVIVCTWHWYFLYLYCW